MKTRVVFGAIIILALLSAILIPALNSCNNSSEPSEESTNTVPPPAVMSFSVVQVFPHDTSAYTQGLTFYKGGFYEGTGEWGHSRLRQVDLKTGRSVREIKLDSMYFGEGIAILNDTLYQLTYKEKVVFAYTVKDFKKVRQFPLNTEGWGLTHDGRYLIASDGGSNLFYYEPSTFQLVKKVEVTEGGNLSHNLNELEFAEGYIYANQYESPYILKIDPSSGKVVAKADISNIWREVRQKDPRVNVPNGIAYDSSTRKMYITGKWWPELYEIQFSR